MRYRKRSFRRKFKSRRKFAKQRSAPRTYRSIGFRM